MKKSVDRISQNPICTDDFGNLVYSCHWTGVPVSIVDSVIGGGFYPGVKSTFICSPDHKHAKKESHRLFNEMDMNCNNCKHLDRVKREKNSAGFLFGKCLSDDRFLTDSPYAYAEENDVMMFHPDDWMGMLCYEQREN